MKAISILKPLELSIETKEESWIQGSTIQGLFKIRNLEASDYQVSQFKIALGYADIKKVHAKKADCFKIHDHLDLPQQAIKPNGILEFPFEFKLPPNITVSDKKASFHLLYGKSDSLFHLQIAVLPQPIFLELVKLLDTFFRFKLKEFKGTGKGIEFILIPPTSRDYASVECLSLALSTEEEKLILDFTFSLKKLDLTGITNKLVKEIKVISKTLSPKEYLMGKTYLDQDKLLKAFELILNEVKVKGLF